MLEVGNAAVADPAATAPAPAWKIPVLHLELTNHCNLKCVICPHPIMRRPKGLMDLALALRLIGDARGRIRELNFSFFGEPLLHPKLSTILEALHERDFDLCMNTNAVLLDHKRAPLLAAAKLDQLRISLDSSEPDTYRRIRIGSDYDRVTRNTIEFLERDDRGPARLVMVSNSVNHDEHDAFLEFWKPRVRAGDEILVKNILSWTGVILDSDQVANPVCPLWDGHTVVGWDGRVSACFLDYEQELTIGHVDDVDIWNIRDDPMYAELARQYHAGENGTCNRCFDKNRKIVLWRAGE